MEIIVDQGSDNWRDLRKGESGLRINASEVATATGVSPFALPSALFDFRTQDFDTHWEDNNAIKMGMRDESRILGYYSELTGCDVKKGNYWVHPKYPEFYGCTPDGQIYDAKGELQSLVEAKRYTKRMRDTMPAYHMTQVQCQLWVTGAKWCDYIGCYIDDEEKVSLLTFRVFPDSKYVAWMLRRLLRFTCSLIDGVRPEYGTAESENDLPPPVMVTRLSVYIRDWLVVRDRLNFVML